MSITTCIAEQEQDLEHQFVYQTNRQPQCKSSQAHQVARPSLSRSPRCHQMKKLQKAIEEKEEAEVKRQEAKDQLIQADNVYIRALEKVIKEKDNVIKEKDETIDREEKMILQVLRLPSIGIPSYLKQQLEECCITSRSNEDDSSSVSSGYSSCYSSEGNN